MKAAPERFPQHLRRMGAAYLVLLISLIPCAVVFLKVRQNVADRDKARFEQVVNQVQTALDKRMRNHLDALRSVRGLLAASEHISDVEWQTYLHNVDMAGSYPGLMDIGYLQRVPAGNLANFEASLRNAGYPNPYVRPSGERAEYFPVKYLGLPSHIDRESVGWDPYKNVERQVAMAQARDTGNPISTGRTELYSFHKAERIMGLVIYLPVYRQGAVLNTVEDRREHLLGFIFGSFKASELWEGVLLKSDNPAIAFHMHDGPEIRADNVLFANTSATEIDPTVAPRFQSQSQYPALGRVWTLHFSTLPEFDLESRSYLPVIVLICGLTISFMLFGVAWVQGRGRERAERLTADLSQSAAALRESENKFRSIFESIQDVYVRVALDGTIIAISPSCSQLFGHLQEEMIGKNAATFYADSEQRKQLLQVIASDGPVLDYEVKLRHKSGAIVVASINGHFVLGHDGAAVALDSILRNITERKQAEVMLRQSEERYRAFVQQSSEGIWRLEFRQPVPIGLLPEEQLELIYSAGYLAECNDVTAQMYGFAKAKEVVGLSLEWFLVRANAQNEASLRSFIRHGYRLVDAESRMVGVNGVERWFLNNFIGTVEDGKLVRVWGSRRDITERHHSLESQRASEQRFLRHRTTMVELARQQTLHSGELEVALRQITEASARSLEVARVSVWLLHEDNSILRCADLFELAAGKHSSGLELNVRDYPQYFSALEEDRVIAAEDAQNDPRTAGFRETYLKPYHVTALLDAPIRLGGRTVGIVFHEHTAGTRVWEADEQDFAGSMADMVSLALEARDRQRVEQALRESEERFRRLAENARDVIYRCWLKPTLRVDYVSPSLTPLTGYRPEEFYADARLGLKLLAPDDALIEMAERDIIGFISHPVTMRWHTRDGRQIWVEALNSPVFDPAGGVVAVEGVVRDVTEAKKTDDALAEEKERLIVTLRSIGDGVITTNVAGQIVMVNKAAEHLTGWNHSEAEGKPLQTVFRIINEKTRLPCANPVERVLVSGETIGPVSHTILIGRDGTERIIADTGAPIRDKEGAVIGIVLVFRDVTDKLRMEAELFKAGKLESVGLLAGGIAHDFNNILTGIVGNISLAKILAPLPPAVIERLEQAERASLRAKDLTQQLLTFSKGGAPIKRTTQLSELVADSIDFALRGSNVRAEFSLPPDLWPADVDESQISQVLNNLTINALQAMPKGGVVTVSARNCLPERGGIHGLPVGRYIRITIKDEGCGIRPEHLPRIFDPYFTTKKQGSGLGLATAYSIIRKHSGVITVHSMVEVGTTFDIFLPASEKPAERLHESNESSPRGNGRVLVMDDEAAIRQIARIMLEHLGYRVSAVETGEQALIAYAEAKEQQQPFCAVIMDLTVPGGMGGKEAIAKLLEMDTDAKALVSSGYSNDTVMADYGKFGFKGVVAKPYRIEDLAKAMASVVSPSG